LMKRALLLQGMGWGHMPEHLVAEDIKAGHLLSLAGDHLKGNTVELVAARRRDVAQGPVATRLWRHLAGRVI
jgi:DNA-binding transcriptional LysR family regulator